MFRNTPCSQSLKQITERHRAKHQQKTSGKHWGREAGTISPTDTGKGINRNGFEKWSAESLCRKLSTNLVYNPSRSAKKQGERVLPESRTNCKPRRDYGRPARRSGDAPRTKPTDKASASVTSLWVVFGCWIASLLSGETEAVPADKAEGMPACGN
ncbi:hypothetical protein BV898_05419 [Hypsibius exemplaris]|uniref:Uncharacterized protein n=1 Tax=Hypsibius exemplaris TaxID=2072580 RepID=A0A1W0WZH5_HYPEX|nr:hypothetical protein BV898_05419 [Hypsibius exemplaris]